MRKTLLAIAVWAACSTMAANAAVTSGSLYQADTTITEDLVLTGDKQLPFTDGTKAAFGVWTFDNLKVVQNSHDTQVKMTF